MPARQTFSFDQMGAARKVVGIRCAISSKRETI